MTSGYYQSISSSYNGANFTSLISHQLAFPAHPTHLSPPFSTFDMLSQSHRWTTRQVCLPPQPGRWDRRTGQKSHFPFDGSKSDRISAAHYDRYLHLHYDHHVNCRRLPWRKSLQHMGRRDWWLKHFCSLSNGSQRLCTLFCDGE